MTLHLPISASRRALNPVLSDMPVISAGESAMDVFYTPSAQWIARHMELIVATASGVCLGLAWAISALDGPDPLEHLFVLLAFAIAGTPALPEVWAKLRQLQIDIDLLMILGAVLAVYIGSAFEGAILLFLFALSGGLESFALQRTQSAIVSLRELAPTEATLIDESGPRRVPLRQVTVGARVLVKPGEKIPVDGVVVGGSSSVDESAITGESIPRDCGLQDTVFAGTQNLNGRLEVRVSKLAADSTLAKIVELVTESRHHPARAQRLIDRIGPTYSAIVILASVATAVVGFSLAGLEAHEAIRRGIAVLIVASPCALIIATPVAYLSAIASAARRGVLVKGGAHLEVIARARAVAFDKTGTLTTGKVRLTDVKVGQGIDENEALQLVGALEASSNHPLAAAVNHAVQQRKLTIPGVSEYRSIPGEGEAGVAQGRSVWVGRPELLPIKAPRGSAEEMLLHTNSWREDGKTVSAMVVDESVGLLGFEDTLRDRSAACVKRLRGQGIEYVEMLTGDHETIARRVSGRLGLDGFRAAMSPQGKLAAIQELRRKFGTLILVGDGINDAPALAHADVGIAMGSMGADVALDAAHVVVMKDRIERVAWLHSHAQRTASIVRQNLTLAIGVIAVLSVFAACGHVPLPLAVVGHEGSTVLVALNALRLLRSRDD